MTQIKMNKKGTSKFIDKIITRSKKKVGKEKR